MNAHAPNLPEDGESLRSTDVPPGSPGDSPDPSASNPCTTRYQHTTPPDLDAGDPQLKSNELRRMNHRALMFLAAIVALLLMLAFFMFSASGHKESPKPRAETLMVPDAPKPLPRPVPALPQPIPLAYAPARAAPLLPTTNGKAPPPLPPQPQGPTLIERRTMTEGALAPLGDMSADQPTDAAPGAYGQAAGSLPGFPGAGAGQPATARLGHVLPDVSNAQPLNDPDTVMLRGTYIRCVLETRIITDVPGFTSCVVSEPVYSFNGRRLLLPKGSRVLGKYDTDPNGNRVAVIWDRIVTPTGIDVNMASPGMDNLGGAGHPGVLDSHWASRMGAALLISMLSDAFKYEAAQHGPRNTTISNGYVTQTPFESNTAQTIQNFANQAVQRSANRPPTVTINQGTVVTIYVARDVDFNAVLVRS